MGSSQVSHRQLNAEYIHVHIAYIPVYIYMYIYTGIYTYIYIYIIFFILRLDKGWHLPVQLVII